MNNELKTMWKEVVMLMAKSKVLPQNMPRQTEENY
jgi:hypothetical protein